jgi:hypothetical protein
MNKKNYSLDWTSQNFVDLSGGLAVNDKLHQPKGTQMVTAGKLGCFERLEKLITCELFLLFGFVFPTLPLAS